MPATHRGSFTIVNGAETTRHGFGDLNMPTGVLDIGGRSGVAQSITAINAELQLNSNGSGGAISLNSVASSFSLNSNTGNAQLNVTGGLAGNIILTTSNLLGGNVTISSTGATGPTTGLIAINTANASAAADGIKLDTNGSKISIGTNSIAPLASGDVYISRTGKTTFVEGSMVVAQDLTINGTLTTVNTETLTVKDNIILLNKDSSNASASIDAGILTKRGQTDNDTGIGAIVTDSNPYEASTTQTGSTATTIVLNASANSANDFYNGSWIKITSGGANNNVRKIVSYVGTTRTATVSSAFTATPNTVDQYSIYLDKEFTGLIYRESTKEWILASTATNPTLTTNSTDYTTENLRVKDIIVEGEISGSIVGFKTATVTINENNGGNNSIPGLTKTRGAGRIIVTGSTAGSASAVFDISKSVAAEAGQVQRVTSSTSSLGAGPAFAELDVSWAANSAPVILHSTLSATSTSVTYNVVYIVL